MFEQLALFDKALYKIERVVYKKVKKVARQVENYIQTKIKILANQFYMCLPDPEGGAEIIITNTPPKKKSIFDINDIKYFMNNIFGSKPREVLF